MDGREHLLRCIALARAITSVCSVSASGAASAISSLYLVECVTNYTRNLSGTGEQQVACTGSGAHLELIASSASRSCERNIRMSDNSLISGTSSRLLCNASTFINDPDTFQGHRMHSDCSDLIICLRSEKVSLLLQKCRQQFFLQDPLGPLLQLVE